MSKVLLLMAGGGIGTLLRYQMANLTYRFSSGAFPTGTLVVNLIGSFIIGCAWAFFERSLISPNIRLFFMIGLLGGFTTFSTFALENFNLIRDGSIKFFIINVLVSNIAGILLVFAGFKIVSAILMRSKIGG
ncbi:MAG: fluoride efflux transporter CrcB [Elusimicrobiales bacterium]|nr:fluoride efflux transporter CrcB [Elusimicrobiales bacterium]